MGFFRTKEQRADAEQPFLQLLLFPFTFVIGREQNSAKANQLKLHMEPKVNVTFCDSIPVRQGCHTPNRDRKNSVFFPTLQ